MKEKNIILFLISPTFFLFFLFVLWPQFWGLWVSLTNEALTGALAKNPQFVGLDNYVKVFSDYLFYNSAIISTMFVLGSAIIGQVSLGLILAILTIEKRKIYKKIAIPASITMAIVYTSWTAPEIIAALIWSVYTDAKGTLSVFLSNILGIPNVNLLLRQPLLSIVLANVWWGTGWSMLLFRSALMTVPKEVEEAAEIDGASAWSKFWKVVFPLLKGPFVVNIILVIIWTYGVFGMIYAMTGGGPLHMSETLTVYAYNVAFKFWKLSYGITISIFILLITLSLVLVYYRLLEKEKRR